MTNNCWPKCSLFWADICLLFLIQEFFRNGCISEYSCAEINHELVMCLNYNKLFSVSISETNERDEKIRFCTLKKSFDTVLWIHWLENIRKYKKCNIKTNEADVNSSNVFLPNTNIKYVLYVLIWITFNL